MPQSLHSDKGSDAKRHSEKLSRYLLALEAVEQAMLAATDNVLSGEAEPQCIPEALLSGLAEAFNSETAFYTDHSGRIVATEPRQTALDGKLLPPTRRIKQLLQEGEPPLVLRERDGPAKELAELAIRSLLVVQLRLPEGTYLIGVCNGRDEPLYTTEDKKFLARLMGTLQAGTSQGHAQAEVDRDYRLYLEAVRRGEYRFLSRASEDYARRGLRRESNPKKPLRRKRIPGDELLAEYLDAELCKAMSSFQPRNDGRGAAGIAASDDCPPNHPLSLIRLTKNCDQLIVKLRDNDVETVDLDPRQYQLTALAAARIGLWAGYISAGAKAPILTDRIKPTLDMLDPVLCRNRGDKSKSAALFYALPEWLLKHAQPPSGFVERLRSQLWRVDWLRTCWQKICYIAHSGISEARSEWMDEIQELYKAVRPLTAQMLKRYLEHNEKNDGLHVDSDWLATWLISNTLLSEALDRYYALEDRNNGATDPPPGDIPVASPANCMRFFAHLSQLVLYGLHCTRDVLRADLMQSRSKPETSPQRTPFADVPMGLTATRSESQLYVISEYAYHEIRVPPELNFYARLQQQLRYELSLYAASEMYRDHLYHVLDVCLLGELLLRSEVELPESEPSTVLDLVAGGIDPKACQQLLCNWYVAALCHDLGYVVENASKLMNPISKIQGPGLKKLWKQIDRGLVRGGKQVRQATKKRLKDFGTTRVTDNDWKATESTDHAVVAWLHMNQWLDDEDKEPQEYVCALDAILRHNLTHQQVIMCREPLSVLLMLCDHLQEWGRARVRPDPLAQGVMEALRYAKQASFDRSMNASELIISGFELLSVDPRVEKTRACEECRDIPACDERCARVLTRISQEGLDFKISYLEIEDGEFEPVISWLLLCRDLQCLGNQKAQLAKAKAAAASPSGGGVASSLPEWTLEYPVSITLEYTQNWLWQELPGRPLEMDLFHEYVNAHGPSRYLNEWVKVARRGEQGIEYKPDREKGVETFTMRLNKLGQPLPRRLLKEHWEEFHEWRARRLNMQYVRSRFGFWPQDRAQ